MPASDSFFSALSAALPQIIQRFGTPFHIYDEAGILDTGRQLNAAFADLPDFREFYAVKALPNLRILDILRRKLGFGFDCSSLAELQMARMIGASGSDIFFSSNNTSQEEYLAALGCGGAILNLDDLSFVDKVPAFPDLISIRFNPGTCEAASSVIGKPQEAKFGLRTDQLVPAFLRARERGATRFGLHTMLLTNARDWQHMYGIVEMMLQSAASVSQRLGAPLEFVNIGGGIGIPYRPGESRFDLDTFAARTSAAFHEFKARQGWWPRLYMECGRAITGPHGVMVAQVINRMSKYREFVGVDASMSALMRPGMYPHAYNHVTVLGPDGREKTGQGITVDVVGSLCENNDKFAEQIDLPETSEGDYLLFHDTGAHGHAMGFQYNGRLRPQELLLRTNGKIECIRRAETIEDYLATQTMPCARRFVAASDG